MTSVFLKEESGMKHHLSTLHQNPPCHEVVNCFTLGKGNWLNLSFESNLRGLFSQAQKKTVEQTGWTAWTKKMLLFTC